MDDTVHRLQRPLTEGADRCRIGHQRSSAWGRRSVYSRLPLHRFPETCLPFVRSPQRPKIPSNSILHQIWSV
jgi:hypothetical protein